MVVTANGEAKDTQSNKAGIYVLGPNPVNSKPHWLQNTGTHAIWYNEEKEIWAIGLQKSLGSNKAWIYSSDDVASPQEATTWIYYDKKWITSDDVLVDTFVEPGLYIQIIYHTRTIITRSRFETALNYKPRIFRLRRVSL